MVAANVFLSIFACIPFN